MAERADVYCLYRLCSNFVLRSHLLCAATYIPSNAHGERNQTTTRGPTFHANRSRPFSTYLDKKKAVAIEFPTINETTFGRKAGPWLAQATFRIKKHNSKKEKGADDISEISGEDEDDSSANENIGAHDDGSSDANENSDRG